jgi:hypothetical protein
VYGLCLLQIGLFGWVEEHMHLFKENHPLKKLQHLPHCFPVRTEWLFQRNTSSLKSFSRSRRLTLFQIHIRLSWKNTCISRKKLTVLEVEASSTLLPCDSWVHFWKEYYLQIRIFKLERSHLVSNGTIQLTWGNTCISEKNNSVRNSVIKHIVFLWELI